MKYKLEYRGWRQWQKASLLIEEVAGRVRDNPRKKEEPVQRPTAGWLQGQCGCHELSQGAGRTWALLREMRNCWRMLSREGRKVILVFKDSSSFFLRIYCFGPNRKQGAPSGGRKMTETHDQTCFSPTSLAHLLKHKLDQDMSPNPLHRTFQGSPQPP